MKKQAKVKKQTKAQAKKQIERLRKATGQGYSGPLIEVSQKEGANGVMTGANTLLLVDGKPLKGAQSFAFEVSAKGVAKATITLVGRFKINGKILTKTVKLYK
jgi:hypothetical protein